MSRNKLSKFADMNSFPHVFQFPAYPFYRSDTEFNLKGKWNKDFFQNDFPIILELGCGKGEYTIGLAELYPEKNIIGIDIKGARMWTGAKYSFEKQMKNVAFLRTNIEAVHYFFGENEVSEIWLPFPDPQMKKVRKRLTSTHFMKIYQQFVKPSGLIHLKTDSNFMFTYTCEMVKINHYPVRYITEDVYNSDNNDPALKIQTFYESQWIERGLKIKYLQFNLEKRETFFEPDIEIERDTYRSFGRNKN
ncbi:MAG TPA: tRNA (guanosine(46)-N7)-methyltransferase TrmB [Paludibacteraceae bacterium]|nr:tRNA (guanosine(46)-N7)-methyltransferase TrmB [Paludibacteraceae bacterium]HOK36800.1 tRNA (guanosine(46)-N7)-methyltransferase TrmB [Paludibacteraceae bacterium]HOL00275.1 tRNA (guanosine(46)-N7)-methyltransferase TrmB [Paludibacteraceae bacterium]HPO67077.1 tRNA (guanosine(46)-N7)-methyltransferase TrmB [Paludibacteraceae bacterium]